jgi:hypothetical protein
MEIETEQQHGNASGTLGGALGSFISASTAGNEVHKMHPSFEGQWWAKSKKALRQQSSMTTMHQQQRYRLPAGMEVYQQSLQRAEIK